MQDGLLLDGDGEIDLPSFELAMRHQLADYTQARASVPCDAIDY